MSVSLIVARPAGGKTDTCIQEVRNTLAKKPLAQVWVVVPDRLQASAFRRRLAQTGGALGAHVGSFGDLYKNILERAGMFVPVASSPLLHRLVQESIDLSIAQGEISHYATLQRAPGFILALRDSFAELKRSLIYPDQLAEYARNGIPAQQELSILYTRYQNRLRELNWADPEGLSWLAVEVLKKQADIVSSIQLLAVDGFDSFTGAQRKTLQLLSTQVNEMLITFPGEMNSRRPAHRRFTTMLATLQQELSAQVISLEGQPRLSPETLHLEQHVFDADEKIFPSKVSPFLIEARSPEEEARESLRWIKARVVRHQISLTECAIFTPSPDVYNPLLRLAAVEFGIPIRFTQSESLNASPAIAAFMNLLALPAQNFKARTLLNILRSPYFDFGLDHQTVDVLEKIGRVARIVEGREQWDETWLRLAPSAAEQLDLDEELSLPGLPHGVEVEALKVSLTNFFTRITPPVQSMSQTNWLSWLETLLDDLHFYQNADQERDQLACESLREAMRALVLSESVAGERKVDYEQFLSDLQGALDGVGLPDVIIKGQPALMVGRITEARGLRFQAVVIMGLSEGVFPVVERSDPFLEEGMREALGLESRLQREQAGLFYQAITRADTHLLITRPYLSVDGENWEASPFWKAAQTLFDGSAIQRIKPDDLRPLSEAASSQELLFWAVRRKSLPGKFSGLQMRWDTLRHARDVLKARRANQARNAHEGFVDAVAPQLNTRYSPKQAWSASRLETYGSCPHMFYVKVALGLESSSPPELGLDAAQVGSMLHKILADVYQAAQDPTDVDAVLKELPQAAQKVFTTAPEEFGFRPSPLWEVEQAQFLEDLEATISALGEDSDGWTPFAYEQMFGIKGTPVLEVDLGSETVRLHGVIDRLDHDANGNLRVIDYKTGGSNLSQGDLKDGRRLQLPLYAMAARDALGLGAPVEGIYWKIRAAESGPLKLSKFKTESAEGMDAAEQVVKEHLLRIITGIRAADFPPMPPKGGCPSYCPAAQWCWRYEPSSWGAK